MQPYGYRPLDKDTSEVRLLRIENTADEAVPVITLRHANLDSGEKFNALSYAWGEESPIFPIKICDGAISGSLHVRENLYDFLRLAQTSKDDWSSEWIWIDQICINQRHHEERCHQVNQMAKLYSSAQATIIWPGSRSNSPHLLANQDEDLTMDPMLGPQEVIDASRSSPFTEAIECLLRTISFRSLKALTCSLYWERLWIIQEICLASRACILIHNELWELKNLTAAISRLPKLGKQHMLLVSWGDHLPLWLRLYKLALFAPNSTLNGEIRPWAATWASVLGFSTYAQCTVPHDRIYAIMGLLPEVLRVQPDYTLSHEDLLKSVLKKQIDAFSHDTTSLLKDLGRILHEWESWTDFELDKPHGTILLPPYPDVEGYTSHVNARRSIGDNDILLPRNLEREKYTSYLNARGRIRDNNVLLLLNVLELALPINNAGSCLEEDADFAEVIGVRAEEYIETGHRYVAFPLE